MNKALNVYETPRLERPVLKTKHLHQFDREFLRSSGASPDMSVLEIGCGTGIFLRYLAKRGFNRVTAIDSDPELAETLADLPQVAIHYADALSFVATLAPASLDRIALFDVAEHIPVQDLVVLMQGLHAALKPGGRIVMRVPNCSSPWGMKCYFGSFDHVTPFTPERLAELGTATGFRLAKVFGSDTGTGLRKLAQGVVHWIANRCLVYHPDYWEVCLIGVLEKPVSLDDGGPQRYR
jgi:SAM-dependent methyltransferase